MQSPNQSSLTDYEARKEKFEHVKAQVLKLVNRNPGLTVSELTLAFPKEYGYLPRIDNRLRDLRKDNLIFSKTGPDNLLHWYPIDFLGKV